MYAGKRGECTSTLMPPPKAIQNGDEGEIDMYMYVQELEQTVQKAHDAARQKLKSAQKSMKRAHGIRMRTCPFRVGDFKLVYWRRNAGKKMEYIWKGTGVMVKAKSDIGFIVKSHREVQTMLHDKLKKCEATEIPRWLRNYQRQDIDEEPSSESAYPTSTSAEECQTIEIYFEEDRTHCSPAEYFQPICWRRG